VGDYMYIAKTAGPNTSIKSAYIVFLTKLQKNANPPKWIYYLDIRKHNVFEIIPSFAPLQ
jgi:hypothetical protein